MCQHSTIKWKSLSENLVNKSVTIIVEHPLPDLKFICAVSKPAVPTRVIPVSTTSFLLCMMTHHKLVVLRNLLWNRTNSFPWRQQKKRAVPFPVMPLILRSIMFPIFLSDDSMKLPTSFTNFNQMEWTSRINWWLETVLWSCYLHNQMMFFCWVDNCKLHNKLCGILIL